MKDNILEAIGDTPLVKLNLNTPALVCAKLEFLNPGGSIKDRAALYMIEQAEQSGRLKPGGTIIEATSGNQGIAVAMIGKAKGYKVIIATSAKISDEKRKTIKAYGADVKVFPCVDNMMSPDSYHGRALELAKQTPGSCMLNQYMDPVNSEAYYQGLAPELWQQTGGKLTHFFAAAGTGGTISGVGKFLKEKNPAIKVIAVDAENSYYSTGGKPKPYKIEGMGLDFDTPVLWEQYVDEIIPVADEDVLRAAKELPSKHAILGGMTCGAVMCALDKYINTFKTGDYAVLMFPDSGRAYLSKIDY